MTQRRAVTAATALSKKRFEAIVTCYREYLSFDRTLSPKAVRQELDRIAETLGAASRCIGEYLQGGVDITDETAAKTAWRAVNAEINSHADRPLMLANVIEGLLQSWARAAADARTRIPSKRYPESAALMAADKLIANRKHEGLAVSSTESGATVTELCRIAEVAGDRSLTKTAAAKVLKRVIRRGRERRQ